MSTVLSSSIGFTSLERTITNVQRRQITWKSTNVSYNWYIKTLTISIEEIGYVYSSL